ncbi:hypothetical protein FP568_04605 [Pandoraea pnomenusa]|uniref:hypothetical protein n=1 Tax=Pandoraea pnomenusa TaxID=93220 RepID=UPI001198BB3A|nr:hypothetical protein [Pandoraea pnomenusa]QDX20604.1 hypothetical protein FP568_04605 [Pandoraea pnomenusa]
MNGEHVGFHFVLWLPPQVDEAALVAALREAGVFVEGLREFTRSSLAASASAPALVVGYAALDDARLPQIATRIAAHVWAAVAAAA